MAEGGINSYVMMCGIIAVLILSVVLCEKAGFTQMCFRTKTHPASVSFVGLCIAEIMALVVLVVGTRFVDTPEACVVIGALQHYTFQATLIWLGLFNVDLYIQSASALTTTPISSHSSVRLSEQTQNNVLLGCIAWGVPAATLLTQLLDAGTDAQGDSCYDGGAYGGYGFCFIDATLTFWFPYFAVAALFTAGGLYALASMLISITVASDSAKYPRKLLGRISRDLNGATLSFFSGCVAYYTGSFISANNPDSTASVQAVFAIAVLVHALVLLVYFVAIPAVFDVPVAWGAAAGGHYPISPDGSLVSMGSLGSHQSLAGIRPMAVPRNMMRPHSTSPQQQLASADPDVLYRRRQRKMFAESWRLDLSKLKFFSKRLRAAAPKGKVGYEKIKSVWKLCFPDRQEETEAFVAQAFMALDPNNTNSIDHAELCLFLAICSPRSLEERLANVFALFDLNEDGLLSEEETYAMLQKITDLLNGTSAVQVIQNRNIVEMIMAELKSVMTKAPSGSSSITAAAFVGLKADFNSTLAQTIGAELTGL